MPSKTFKDAHLFSSGQVIEVSKTPNLTQNSNQLQGQYIKPVFVKKIENKDLKGSFTSAAFKIIKNVKILNLFINRY